MTFYVALGHSGGRDRRGPHARHAQGLAVGEGVDTVGDAVAPLVAAGLAALRG